MAKRGAQRAPSGRLPMRPLMSLGIGNTTTMQTDTTTAALIRSTAAMLDEAGAMRAARKGRTVERARARRFKSARAFLAIAFA